MISKNIFQKSYKRGRKAFQELYSKSILYENNLSDVEQRHLFKKNIRLVEFEPNAFCNRQCWHCLNGIIKNRKGELAKKYYQKVIKELEEIEYNGIIHYARYCEPLANPYFEDFISIARAILPDAILKIITNGDYLSPERLQELINSGIDMVSVSLYLSKDISWSHFEARNIIKKLADKLGLEVNFRSKLPHGVFADLKIENIKMDVRCLDFAPGKNGFNRGGIVPDLADSNFIRSSPCYFVFQNFTIDWNGNVMPCCNIHSDFPAHREFILGNIKEQSIFSIYAGDKAISWRKKLVTFEEKDEQCRYCQDANLKSFK